MLSFCGALLRLETREWVDPFSSCQTCGGQRSPSCFPQVLSSAYFFEIRLLTISRVYLSGRLSSGIQRFSCLRISSTTIFSFYSAGHLNPGCRTCHADSFPFLQPLIWCLHSSSDPVLASPELTAVWVCSSLSWSCCSHFAQPLFPAAASSFLPAFPAHACCFPTCSGRCIW